VTQHTKQAIFKVNISQANEATFLKFGRIVYRRFTTNLIF